MLSLGRILHVCLALVLFTTPGAAERKPLQAGQLTGSVASISNPDQYYAVYVPSSLRAGKPSPVLFIMDYRGRARVAAEVFRPAAERYGWILFSSNHTSSDEAPEPSLAALRAMWEDAHDLFDVDPKRLYLAGLSGTARVATWIASELKGDIAGVIGAGAGLSPNLPPAAAAGFLYFGTAGDEDYNYWELRRLERSLTDLDLQARFAFFHGGHAWMPTDVAMDAIGWLELKAMQRGLAPLNRALVDGQWTRDAACVAEAEASGSPLLAARRLAAMVRDYSGLRSVDDVESAKRRRDLLRTQPRSKANAEAERRATESHAARIADAMQTLARAFPRGAHVPIQPAMRTVVDLGVPELLRAASGPIVETALAARRLLAELDVQTGFYLPMQAMEEREDNRAGYYLDIAREINAADPHAWYLRARLLAKASRPDAALSALATGVDRGFRTLDALQRDRAFDPLRGRDEFRRLVERVRSAWEADR